MWNIVREHDAIMANSVAVLAQQRTQILLTSQFSGRGYKNNCTVFNILRELSCET